MKLHVGDHVVHHNGRTSFGCGIIKQINEAAGTARVKWDEHSVERTTPRLTQKESHVNLTSLRAKGSP